MRTTPLMSESKAAVVGTLLIAVGPISMALYTPAMPKLVEVFGTDVATIKLSLTVYFAGFALAQLVCGPLSDAYGRRPIVLGFSALYLIGSLLAVFAPSVEWLLAARVIQGVGAAAGVAISRAIIRDLYTGQESVRIMNTIGLMMAIGPALSPTIGGVTLDLLGWHAIFLFMVGYGVLVVVLFLAVVPETLTYPDPEKARPGQLAASYLSLIKDPRFLRPSIVIACTTGALYAMATMLPFVLIDLVGLTPTEFGTGMLVQSGAFMLGTIIMRQLLKTIEAHRLVPVGLAVIGLSVVLLGALMHTAEPTFLTVMGPVGLFAFGIAFVMPSMMTESLAPFGRIAGAAAALTGFMQMGGGLLGSAVAAMMGDPVAALGTIIPIMGVLALVVYVGMRGATTPMQEAVADRIVAPQAPAE